MERIFWLLILFPLCFTSCSDDDASDIKMTQIIGEYEGYFNREGVESGVTLVISEGSFSGTSEQVKFPAICKGTYSMNGNTIQFVNECPWTAEFDWTLILSGKWSCRLKDDNLYMENNLGDYYSLKKK